MGVNNPNERPKPKKLRKAYTPPKSFRTEATRPVTKPQRKAIAKGVEQARKQQFATNVAKVVARGHAVDEVQRHAEDIRTGRVPIVLHDDQFGAGPHLKGVHGHSKVIVKNGKLYHRYTTWLGLGHKDNALVPLKDGSYGEGVSVDAATAKIAAPAVKALNLAAYPGMKIGEAVRKKTGSKAAGIAGSFLLDPLNYVTLGRGTAIRAAARGAVEHEINRGISVGARAHVPFTNKTFEAKSSGRATAAIGRLVRAPKASQKLRASAPGKLAREFNPAIRPAHRSPAQHEAIRQAERRQRAAAAMADRHAVKTARAYDKAVHKIAKDTGRTHEQVDRHVQDLIEQAPANVPQHLRAAATLKQAQKTAEKATRDLQRGAAKGKRLAPSVERTRSELAKAQRAEAQTRLARRGGEDLTPQAVRAARRRVRRAESAVEQATSRTRTATGKRKLAARQERGAARQELGGAKQASSQAEASLQANRLTSGTAGEQATAINVQKLLDHLLEQKSTRGISKGPLKPTGPSDAQGYFPHTHQGVIRAAEEEGHPPVSTSGQVKPKKESVREIRKSLRVLEAEGNSPFTREGSKVIASKIRSTGRDVGLHDLWQAVAKTGKRVVPGQKVPKIEDGEALYRVSPHGLEKVHEPAVRGGGPDPKEIQAIEKGRRDGDYVVLHEKSVEDVVRNLSARAKSQDSTLGRTFDRVQGGLKFASTIPNPSYHSRNLLGDSMNAYLADTTFRDFVDSGRAMKVLKAREHLRGAPEAFTKVQKDAEEALHATVKIKGKKVRILDELEAAEREGAIRTGQAGAEFRELLGGSAQRGGRLRSISEYREDYARFAAYLAARKRGLSQSESAAWSLKHLFDYGDLTPTERTFMRRAIPFYTFFARNTALQASKLITRPGKIANVGKVYNIAAQEAGYKNYDDYVAKLDKYKQRGLPFPLKVGGKTYDVTFSPPQTDLNQLTTSYKTQVMQNIAARATFLKAAIEIPANYSIFFQGQIEDPKAPLVPAPAWMNDIQPKFVRDAIHKKLGIAQYVDKRTGRRIWGWPAKLDYLARQTPETSQLVAVGSQVRGSRGQTWGQQALGFVSPFKVVNHDEVNNQVNRLYDQQQKLNNKLGQMNQRLGKLPDGTYRTSAEKERLKAQLKQINTQIGVLRVKRGDSLASIPRNQRPSGGRPQSLLTQVLGPSASDITGGAGVPSASQILNQP